MPKRKKSKYKYVAINKKKYYFFKIVWIDITGDAGHATKEEFDKFECARMVSFAYVYKKTRKGVWTFASFDEKEEVFSDRNVFPTGCIVKMEKLNVESRQSIIYNGIFTDCDFVCLGVFVDV